MDIENTNKPDVILNKKNGKTADTKPESGKADSKKKFVVKVSKNAAGKSKKPDSAAEDSSAGKTSGKQIISVKKVSPQSSKPVGTSTKEKRNVTPREDKRSEIPPAKSENQSSDSARREEKQPERKKLSPSSMASIDFASKRPM